MNRSTDPCSRRQFNKAAFFTGPALSLGAATNAFGVSSQEDRELIRSVPNPQGYIWQQGAVLAAECLATGRELLATPEHALHVLEIITAARQSHETGRRIAMTSTFRWPVIA